jgi:hypothetical protein
MHELLPVPELFPVRKKIQAQPRNYFPSTIGINSCPRINSNSGISFNHAKEIVSYGAEFKNKRICLMGRMVYF